ncbi:MAG: hypothetical protein ACM3S1_07535 [Hyphomicrobiales bacterium]
MDALGMREWVGLAGLAIAVLVALSFCNPAVGTETEPRPITLGEPVTPTAVPSSPTPTAVPPTDLGAPENWFVQYFTGPSPADGVEDSRGFVDTLDVEHEVAPYPGLRDDDWSLVASAHWRELPAGRYAFTLESDGAVRVIANGKRCAANRTRRARGTSASSSTTKAGRWTWRSRRWIRAGRFCCGGGRTRYVAGPIREAGRRR